MKTSERRKILGSFLVLAFLFIASPALADSIESMIYPESGFGAALTHSTDTLGKKPASGWLKSMRLPLAPAGDYGLSTMDVAIESLNNGARPNGGDDAAGFYLSLVNSTGDESGSSDRSDEVALNTASYLDSGQSYWLGVRALSGAGNGAWQFNNVGANQPWSFNTSLVLDCPLSLSCAMVPNASGSASQSTVATAATVTGDTVTTPEPSLLFLVATGALLLGLARARAIVAKSR